MCERRILPPRRACETFEITHGDQRTRFQVTVGYFAADLLGPAAPAEVFITGAKSGSAYDALARDSAILLSFLMQHGIALELVRRALTREENGAPSSIICKVVDRLTPVE